MLAHYTITFSSSKGKKEILPTVQGEFHSLPLGSFLISFLSIDFTSYKEQLFAHKSPKELRALLPRMKAEISNIHPLLECALRPINPFYTDELGEMKLLISKFILYQETLSTYVDRVLLSDGSSLSPLQKYCKFLTEDCLAAKRFMELPAVLHMERKIYCNGVEFNPYLQLHAIPASKEVTSSLVITSNDFEAILLVCFEQMVENDVYLKRCEYCGLLFHPYSRKAIYCDRPIDNTGKTCKIVAAREKHEKKTAANDGLLLYRKQDKAYSMRVRRAPNVYKDADYQKWKIRAKAALDMYIDGNLTFTALVAYLELPPIK